MHYHAMAERKMSMLASIRAAQQAGNSSSSGAASAQTGPGPTERLQAGRRKAAMFLKMSS